jgi:hypothetical protein
MPGHSASDHSELLLFCWPALMREVIRDLNLFAGSRDLLAEFSSAANTVAVHYPRGD